jgi:hypothetical protein
MAKIYYRKRKKFFGERYKEFRRAYYAWARYDPYKRYGKPDERKARIEAERQIKLLRQKSTVTDYGYLLSETTRLVIQDYDKKIRNRGKQDKKILRRDLKEAFKNLFIGT